MHFKTYFYAQVAKDSARELRKMHTIANREFDDYGDYDKMLGAAYRLCLNLATLKEDKNITLAQALRMVADYL